MLDCLKEFFVSFILNCQMRNLCENQNLFQILIIKVKRDMYLFPFNKTIFTIPQNNSLFLKKHLGGMVLASYNISIFDNALSVHFDLYVWDASEFQNSLREK